MGERVDIYTPLNIGNPETLQEVIEWVANEHRRIGLAIEVALARKVEFLNVAPSKPFEGMIRGADGTNWNPGGGQGIYAYYNSTWNKLG